MVASKRIRVVVTTQEGEMIIIQAWTVHKVCDPLPRVDWSREKSKWTHLADLPLKATGGKIDLLLGSDHVDAIIAQELRIGKEFEPVAAKTRFGWLVVGRSGETTPKRCLVTTREELDLQIDRALKEFFATENFGAEKVGEFLTKEEEEAQKIVRRDTRKLEVGYEVGLPWKTGEPRLENNKAMAENRLKSLLRRFEKDPDFEKDYDKAIKKYETEGYASRVQEDNGPAFYLPHHGVYKNTLGPNKLRVVFNAAAPFRGKCLNDALYKGPAWLNQLPQMLIKFRERRVAFTADIEAMFSRIRLKPEDARYHRFLWKEESPRIGKDDHISDEPLDFRRLLLPFRNGIYHPERLWRGKRRSSRSNPHASVHGRLSRLRRYSRKSGKESERRRQHLEKRRFPPNQMAI